MNLQASSLIDTLNCYIADLTSIQHSLSNHRSQPHIMLLSQKLTIKIHHFSQSIKYLQNKTPNKMAVQQLATHASNGFHQSVKQAHRLLQVQVGKQGQQRLMSRLDLLKDMQKQMGEVWQGPRTKQEGLLRKINQSVSALAVEMDHGQLRAVAKEYLHKEFLAIRMISYKLYEQYMGHGHHKIKEQMQELRNQQQKLQAEMQELREIGRQLKGQEKQLARQLKQLKGINDITARRYFTANRSTSQHGSSRQSLAAGTPINYTK